MSYHEMDTMTCGHKDVQQSAGSVLYSKIFTELYTQRLDVVTVAADTSSHQ